MEGENEEADAEVMREFLKIICNCEDVVTSYAIIFTKENWSNESTRR